MDKGKFLQYVKQHGVVVVADIDWGPEIVKSIRELHAEGKIFFDIDEDYFLGTHINPEKSLIIRAAK